VPPQHVLLYLIAVHTLYESTQDKKLIYDTHKISFHKATSPQYYKRVHHVLTKIPIPRRSYTIVHKISFHKSTCPQYYKRELNSSWYLAKRRSTIWLKASVLSAPCCCTYSYTFLVVQVNVIEITFFSELAHTKPETFVATVTLTGLESTCHHRTYKHCTSPVTILPGTVLLKCFPIQLL